MSGKNVEDNWRVRWMTGYYYKVINENNRRVTVGLNNMIWHYDKDLSGYSLGQGGYYSPQEYLSFAVPVMWRQRTENWSWELGGSVSWSHSRNRTMPRYPLMNLIPADYQEDARDQTNGGGSSQGFGYTARRSLNAGSLPLVCGYGCRYSAGERLYPQSSAAVCSLFRGGLAGGYGFTAAASGALR